MAEQFVRGQVEGGKAVHGGAQLAHGRGGVQAVADHVAHHQGDPGPGQRNHVEPVAAHAGLGGQVAVGDVQGALLGQSAG